MAGNLLSAFFLSVNFGQIFKNHVIRKCPKFKFWQAHGGFQATIILGNHATTHILISRGFRISFYPSPLVSSYIQHTSPVNFCCLRAKFETGVYITQNVRLGDGFGRKWR